VDHHKPERKSSPGNRLHSAWAGPGEALKRKALEEAFKLAA